MKRTLLVFLISFFVKDALSQFSFSCAKDTTIDCAQSCITLNTTIPNVHAFSDDYGISSISGPGGCFRPPINPGIPGTSTNLGLDDRYTPIIPLPFLFSFYGIYYLQCVVNTNGIISFDYTNAGPTNTGSAAQWIIAGLDGSLPSTDYDRAIIMGAFHDIDISRPNSPTRQIKYDVIGTAPHRKWVLSFYKIPCFQCNDLFNNTYQITLYEGLSLIEMHIFGRDVCTTWNAGAAMVGMQNYEQDKGIMAPGRSAFTTPRWGGANMNEAWRFTPKQGPSLFKSVQLTDLGGNFVADGVVSPGASNDLAVTFPNICPTTTTTYLVKSAYYNLEFPFQFPEKDSIVYGIDTFTVFKNGSIPLVDVTTTPAVCGPNPNGTININAPVGLNYEYSLDGGSTYQPGNSFTVLPGTYTVTVHDVTGTCTKDTTVVVGSPATFTASATSTNTSCPTSSDGSITITPSNAAPGYTFEIDGTGVFVTSNIFTGLTAGSHNISVKDATGCVYGFPHIVLSDAGFSTTASSVNASCTGLLNGTVTVDVPTSGQAPFTYAIGTTVQLSNPLFNGLLGDSTYTIIVTDNIGCADTLTQTVSSNPSVTAIVNTTSAACIGVNTGQIVITPSGGTGPYFYDTTGTGTFVPLTTLNNLASGSYTVVIRDNVGCLYTTPVITVNTSAGVSGVLEVVNSACATATTGRIIIKPGSGVSPFSYSLNSGAYVSIPDITFPIIDTISNLAPGNYSVSIRDNVGCIYNFPPTTIGANPDIIASAISIPTACAAATNGQIVVSTITGISPFTYSIDNGAFTALVDTIRNLDSGFHSIVVRDAVGCSAIINPEVPFGLGVSATFTTKPTACATVATGQIFVSPTAGMSPFTYSIDNGAFTALVDTIRNLDSGFHSIVVRDAVGCSAIINPEVPFGLGVSATFTTKPTACATVATGQIFVSPTAGISPFIYSIDNGAFTALLDTIRNLDSGFHSIVVRDAVGCSAAINPEVQFGPGVSAAFSPKATACATATTGQIFVSPTTGIGPFTYSLDNGAFTALTDTIRNLDSGFHSIIVRDAVGCTLSINPQVPVGPGVSATFTTKPTACAVAATGQIFVAPTAGISPFTFSIDNGAFTALTDTIRNLDSGFHSIIVRDAVGCSATINPQVPVGPGVSATFTTKATACAVAATGQIFVAPTAGIGPFTYSLDNGAFAPLNDTIRNLDSGLHTIVVRDILGCTANLNPVVAVGAGVSATFTTKATACATATTGQIFITPVTVGSGPFTYSLDNGAFAALNDTIRNLDSGLHNIVVRDALGCIATINPSVPVGLGVTVTFTTKATACATATTGQIFITPATVGSGPFTYSLDNGAFAALNDTIRNLDSGLHNIVVRDALGCIATINPAVPFGAGVSATTNSINSACLGVSTGKIIVTPTAGIAPYKYEIGSSGSLALDTIRNLASGNYNIRLTDAVGCSFNVPTVTVNNNAGVTANFIPVKSACAGAATGAIIVKPLTGTRSFSYSIDGGITSQSDSVFRNLAANPYNIRITDALGCILNSPVQNVTNNPGVLTSVSTIQNASCASIPNGSITVNVTAGIPPLTYVVTAPVPGTPQAANQFASLFSGSYSILITDSAGCTKTITPVVGNDPKVKIDSFGIIRPTCNGLQNGSISAHVSLGVAPYQYAIDAGPYGNSKLFSSVGAGVHTLHIKDANNCNIDSVITITEPALLTNAVVSTVKATCTGNPDGKIVVNAAGGTSPYQYTLDAAGVTGYQTAASFDVLKGSYKITVKDDKGCTAYVNTVVDSVFTMFLDLGAEATICSGESLVLNPSTNTETSVFTYSPKASLDNDKIKNPTAVPTDTTTYTVTAEWGICKLTDNIKVNVLRKPVANAGSDVVICFDSISVLRASASNLSGTVNYVWSPANLLDGKADTIVVTARPKEADTYFKVTVTDNYNCNFSVSDSVLVKMLPKVYAFAGNDTNAILNTPHQLRATGAGTGGSYDWSYPYGVTLSENGIANPMATFIPVPEPGTYINPDTNFYRLSVIATDAAGCRAYDTIKVNVFIGPTCYVPNAFSPNGDGLNDIFKPVNVGVNIEYFRLFNRYGEIVYETKQFRSGWNGMFKGKPQLPGAYVWIFKGKDRRGRDIVTKGTVMLVR